MSEDISAHLARIEEKLDLLLRHFGHPPGRHEVAGEGGATATATVEHAAQAVAEIKTGVA